MKGKKDEAQIVAKELKPRIHDRFDALINYGIMKGATEGSAKAGRWLLDESLTSPVFNNEYAYILGCILIKWKKFEYLKGLLVDWYQREDLSCDSNFELLMGLHFLSTGNERDGSTSLRSSVALSPLAVDNVAALGRFYEKSNLKKYALTIWEALANDDTLQENYFQIIYVQALIDAGMDERAQEVSKIYLKKGNHHKLIKQEASKGDRMIV
jgi:hypothetical protein